MFIDDLETPMVDGADDTDATELDETAEETVDGEDAKEEDAAI